MIQKVLQPSKLESYYYQVFQSTDAFKIAVQPHLPVRALLFHTDGLLLSKSQFKALNVALARLNEKIFYISVVESKGSPFTGEEVDDGDHWKGESCSHEEYVSIVNHSFPLLNNALYSESGKWGILISHEFHAIMGCTKEFWEEFEINYTQWRQDYYDFIAYWEHEKDIWPITKTEWLPKFLSGLTVKP